MRVLTEAECHRWCRDHGLALDERERPSLFRNAAAVEKFTIPSDSGARVALVRAQLDRFKDCSSILVWLDAWGVFPSGERMHVFERFRLSYGVKDHLIDKRGHEFGPGEFEDLTSMVTLAVLFLWDCFVLTPSGKPALCFTHDEVGYSAQ